MEEITIQELVSIAKKIHTERKKCHFHMLTPDCMFNERKDKQAFVLENETDNKVFVAYSDERYMEEGKELVKLIHGDKIVEDKETDSKIVDEDIKLILEKTKKLNEQGIHWHHHMLFPNCIFNKHKGKWCIVFEDTEENKITESVSDDEPTNNLRAIEVLYYQQKK